MSTPTDAAVRKAHPIARGVLDYFPDALMEVANVSFVGNEQHNPGQPMHWAKGKSTDEADALLRHLIDRGTFDSDGLRHSAKVAWRALALLQRELDAEAEEAGPPHTLGDGFVLGTHETQRTITVEPWGTGDGPVYGMPRDAWVHGSYPAPHTGTETQRCCGTSVPDHALDCPQWR